MKQEEWLVSALHREHPFLRTESLHSQARIVEVDASRVCICLGRGRLVGDAVLKVPRETVWSWF